MLELDLILIPFYDNCYHDLSSKEQLHFESLLDCTDPELYSWLMGYEKCNDPTLVPLIETIQSYAKTRS